MDPALARTLVEHSNEAVHWMKDHWHPLGAPEGAREGRQQALFRARYRRSRGRGGVGQLEQWRRIAADRISRSAFPPRRAIHGNMHRVGGVRVCTPREDYDLEARAIIACAGGFQASAEMRARYLAGNADLVKVRGSKHDTGEVLNYLLALGAATAGQWQSGHMSPIDAKAPDFETPQHADGRGNTQSRYDYPFGISVNALGVRFFDEGEAEHSYTYAKTGRTILAQPGAVAWQIYDQIGIAQHRYPHHKATFEEARDISELARRIGLAPEVLVHTIEEFNALVATTCRSTLHDPTERKPTASRFQNRTGPIGSTPRRIAPIRSRAGSRSPSVA
jgi:tricarballylate dehydrogenase